MRLPYMHRSSACDICVYHRPMLYAYIVLRVDAGQHLVDDSRDQGMCGAGCRPLVSLRWHFSLLFSVLEIVAHWVAQNCVSWHCAVTFRRFLRSGLGWNQAGGKKNVEVGPEIRGQARGCDRRRCLDVGEIGSLEASSKSGHLRPCFATGSSRLRRDFWANFDPEE